MLPPRRLLTIMLLAASACQGRPASTPAADPTPQLTRTRVAPSPTASPTAPPVPPTLRPSPRFLTEEFNTDADFWTFVPDSITTGGSPAEVRAGLLRMQTVGVNQSIFALYRGQHYADVRVEARVEMGTNGGGTAGLICRYDPAAGWYEFNIHADGTYTMLYGKWLAPGIARYAPLVIAMSEKIDPAVNELGLDCKGDVITPFVNGVQLRKRQERLYQLADGQVGVSVAGFEDDLPVISFDWISISPAQ